MKKDKKEKKKPIEEPEVRTFNEGFEDNESPDQRPKDPPGTNP